VSLATVDQMAEVCPTQAADPNAQVWLDQATALLQALTGQQLLPATDERVLLDSPGGNVLLLPEVPVTDVAQVRVKGVDYTGGEYEWSTDGMVRVVGACASWPRGYQAVEVTYSHGFDPIPADLALAAATLACRLARTSGGDAPTGAVTFEAVGAYQVRYSEAGLSSIESAVIGRYRVPA